MQPVEIDMRRIVVSLTSNRAELTPDLANRCSPVLLRKQPRGYQFKTYPGGTDILGHVRRHQGLYLGAVLAIIRKWYQAGCPHTAETRHDFRVWVQTLDWIVQNLLGEAPLCDGVDEIKVRVTTPALNWLRDAAMTVINCGQGRQELRASQLVRILEQAGVEVPGLAEGADLSEDDVAKKVHQATGRKLAVCFKSASRNGDEGSGQRLTVDGILIERLQEYDEEYRKDTFKYRFSRAPVETPAIGADRSDASFLEPRVSPEIPTCAYGAPNGAPIDAPKKTLIAPNAPNDVQLFLEGTVSVPKDDERGEFENNIDPIGAQAHGTGMEGDDLNHLESAGLPEDALASGADYEELEL